MGEGIDQMGAHVILHHFRHQPGHGAAGTGDQVQHGFAAGFGKQGALDRLHLAADAADAGEELLLVAHRMGHSAHIG